MPYCPSCLKELKTPESLLRCPECGAEFGEGAAWSPLEQLPTPSGSTRGFKVIKLALISPLILFATAILFNEKTRDSFSIAAVMAAFLALWVWAAQSWNGLLVRAVIGGVPVGFFVLFFYAAARKF